MHRSTRFLLQAISVAAVAGLPNQPSSADVSACVSAAKEASVRCWNRCSGSDDEIAQCTDKCDETLNARKQRCSNTANAAAQGALPKLSGVKQGGQDGCYFGECPDDLDKKIDESKDPDEPAPRRTTPTRNRSYPSNPQPAQPVVQMTGICQTPYFWCQMMQMGPVGSACWCASTWGPVNGVTIPQR